MGPSIDLEYIKVEKEDAVIDRTIIDPGKGLIAEITLSIIEEEEITLNRGYRSNYRATSRSRE